METLSKLKFWPGNLKGIRESMVVLLGTVVDTDENSYPGNTPPIIHTLANHANAFFW